MGSSVRPRGSTPQKIVILLVIVLLAGAGAWFAVHRLLPAKPLGEIAIGMESTSVNSLIYLAENQGFFEDNGLKVTIKDDYRSGAAAAADMIEGKVDLATVAEMFVVRQALNKKRMQILVGIDTFLHMKLIGRKDRGIGSVPDLTGKSIGLPMKSAADFMLGRFLELNGLRTDEVNLVDVQAPQAVDALANGTVDAVVAWQPNVLALNDRLGDGAVVFDVQSRQPLYCLVVAADPWTREHSELIERFIASLDLAEEFMVRNPLEGRKIVQSRLGYDDRFIETIWPEHQFSLRLDQSLVIAMEDQARWAIGYGLAEVTTVPDFTEYISENSLKAVRPEAVNLIR